MPRKLKPTPPETPKELAGRIAARTLADRGKLQRASNDATRAADRLLKEMDDVLKRLDRKA